MGAANPSAVCESQAGDPQQRNGGVAGTGGSATVPGVRVQQSEQGTPLAGAAGAMHFVLVRAGAARGRAHGVYTVQAPDHHALRVCDRTARTWLYARPWQIYDAGVCAVRDQRELWVGTAHAAFSALATRDHRGGDVTGACRNVAAN